MDHFALKNGILHAEDVPLTRIAEEVGSPVYVYSRATLERHAQVFKDALAGDRAQAYCLCDQGQSQRLGVCAFSPIAASARTLFRAARSHARWRRDEAGGHRLFRRRQNPRRIEARAGRRRWPVQHRAGRRRRMFLPPSPPHGQDAPSRRCASIQMWMQEPTPKFRPARKKTSSACRLIRRRRIFDAAGGAARPRSARHCAAHWQPAVRSRARSRPLMAASARSSRDLRAAGPQRLTASISGGGLGVPYQAAMKCRPRPQIMARWSRA